MCGATRSDSAVTENAADARAQVAGRRGGRAGLERGASGVLGRGVVEAAESVHGPSAGRRVEPGRVGLGRLGWRRRLDGPGWFLGFWAGFPFLILTLFPISISNSNPSQMNSNLNLNSLKHSNK